MRRSVIICLLSLSVACVASLAQQVVTGKTSADVWLVFNQPKYSPGDTAFFSGYLIGSNSSSSLDRILNIRLIDSDDKAVFRNRVFFQNGRCASQLILPNDLAPGVYLLSCWFEDRDKAPVIVYEKQFVVAGEKELLVNGKEVRFYPEGGPLVQNCTSRVWVTSPYSNVTARVLDDQGKIAQEFKLSENGTGSFTITPTQGRRLFMFAGRDSYDLPKVEQEGIVTTISSVSENAIGLRVQSEDVSTTNAVVIEISNASCTFSSSPFKLRPDTVIHIAAPGNKCVGGFSTISVVDNERILATSLSYVEDLGSSVRLDVSRHSYSPREKVDVNVNINNVASIPVESVLSVSVIHDDITDQLKEVPWPLLDKRDLQSNLFLKKDTLRPTSMSSLGKEWQQAAGKLAHSTPAFFSGTVVIDSIGRELPDSLLVSFYFSKNDFSYQLFASREGRFDFPLLKPYDNEEVFYIITRKGEPLREAKIVVDDLAPAMHNIFNSSFGKEPDEYHIRTGERRRINHAYSYYGGQTQEGRPYEFDEIWHDADKVLDMDKFEPFSTMDEVLSSIMQSTRTRQRNSEKGVRIFLKEQAYFAPGDPIYFINGRMTEDTDLFLSLDPIKISKIGVLRSMRTLSHFGQLGRNGVILVKTIEELPTLKTCQHCLDIVGINKTLPFHSPGYDNDANSNSRIPDLRQALYWNPSLKTDNNGNAQFSFYTSDMLGRYRIVIKGVTAGGQLITAETFIDVDLKD